jgi:hypothetical protein
VRSLQRYGIAGRRGGALLAVAVLLLGPTGCGEPGVPSHDEAPSTPAVEEPQPASAAHTTVRDSAGIRIVSTTLAPHTPEWRIPESPELELGAAEGEEAFLFHRPEFAARLENGTIVVADHGSGELRFFDSEGRPLRRVGRRGQGPGEFQEFNRVVRMAGDTLAIYDFRNRRVTWIAPDGSLVGDASLNAAMTERMTAGTHPLGRTELRIVGPQGSDPPQRWRTLNFAGPTGDGRHVVAFLRAARPVAQERDTVRGMVEVALIGSGQERGEVLDSLAASLQFPLWLDRSSEGGGWIARPMGVPFAAEPFVAVGDGRVVLSRGDRYEVRVLDLAGGRELRIRRADVIPEPVDQALRDRFVAWRLSVPGRRVEQVERDQANAAFGILGDAQRLPTIAELHLDDAGRIWVQDWRLPWERDQPATYTIFGPEGAIEATATLPAELALTHIGRDHLTGVVWDEMGLEYVRVYRIVRDQGAGAAAGAANR